MRLWHRDFTRPTAAVPAAMALALATVSAQDGDAVNPDPPSPAESVTTPTPDAESLPDLDRAAKEAAAEGVAAFRRGDFTSAALSFRRMLALAPDHPVALVNLATAEYQLGHADEAESLLRRSLAIKPDAPEVWTKLGIICLTAGKPRAALTALAMASEQDPDNPRTRNYLGTALAELGWLLGAEAELRQAIDLDSDYAEAHFNLALVYLRRSPPPVELARRHYRKSLSLGGPPDPLVEREIEAADRTPAATPVTTE